MLIDGYQSLVTQLDLPDPDDRHVLAAAIASHADVIVTHNVRDFPDHVLGKWKLQAISPDSLAVQLLSIDSEAVVMAVSQMADAWRRPPGTIVDVLARLERDGLIAASERLRTQISRSPS